MSVARTTEITAISDTGREDAIREGVERARKTLRNVRSCWIKDHEILLGDAKEQHKVTMKVTFVLED